MVERNLQWSVSAKVLCIEVIGCDGQKKKKRLASLFFGGRRCAMR